MSVKRHPDGRWRYRVVVDLPSGNRIRISGCAPRHNNNKDAAKQTEKDHILRTIAEEAAALKGPPIEVPTVREFSKTYLEISKLINKPSSVHTKDVLLRSHIVRLLGDLKLNALTYAVIEDFKVSLAQTRVANAEKLFGAAKRAGNDNVAKEAESRMLSAKTINNCLTVLRRMLVIAYKRGLIEKVPEVEWLRTLRPEFDFLDFEEAERLLAAAVGDSEWRTMILVALRTGMRQGEILALRWEDVDLVKGQITVRRSVTRGVVTTPKSGKSRDIPLGDEVLAALKGHRHLRGQLVFCTDGGRMLKKNEVKHPLWRSLKRAGLRWIGWHTLRHTFASHLVMRGVPLKAAQELMGHATIEMTMRYAHLSPHVPRDAVRLLDHGGANSGLGNGWAKTEKQLVTS
jgi:integrase